MSIIQVYGALIGANLPDGTPLVAHFSNELASFGIPIVVMIMLIPFVSALGNRVSRGLHRGQFPACHQPPGVRNPALAPCLPPWF